MKKRENLVVIVLALALGFFAFSLGIMWLVDQLTTRSVLSSGVEKKIPNQSATNQLKILGDTFSSYSTFRSRDFLASVQEVGFNVRYEDELNPARRVERFNQGEADVVLTTLDQFLKQKPDGKIIGLIDTTVGADAVVLNTKKYPNLKSLVDLTQLLQQARSQRQQLTITFAGDTESEYLALLLNSKFEAFKLSDFQIKRVTDAEDAWKLLQDPNQNVALAVLREPYVTTARQNGYTVILSSKDVPGAIVNVIVGSDRLIESQPEKISNFLAAYYRHIDVSTLDASRVLAQIALDGKLSTPDAVAVLQGIDFFTSIEARDWMTNGTLAKRIDSTAAVLTLAARLNEVPQNPHQLYTSALIDKAAKNTQNLIDLIRVDNAELAKKMEGQGTTISASPSINPNQVKSTTDVGNLLVKGEVKFATDSNQITDESKQTLSKLAEVIAEFDQRTIGIRVIGHTSGFGKPDFNQALSQKRAEAVADYLRSRGLKHKITAVGKSSKQPLASISPQDKRNQRTEIRLVRLNLKFPPSE